MRIALISTGDELLAGDIIDTNAAWLAQCLSEAGFKLSWHVTVGDEMDSLIDAFELASRRSEVCIVNGGLGPTTDDLSAEAAAQWKREGLKDLPEWIARLEDYYARANRIMPTSNLKQAKIPQSAEMVDNPVGTACGFVLPHQGCELFFTPGVPSEFKHMIQGQILPRLLARQQQKVPQLKRWLTFGLSESLLADWLDPISLPQGAVLGYRSAMPTIEVKLSVPADCSPQALAKACQAISAQLDPFVFVEGNKSLAKTIQGLLLERNQWLASAESCTGGLIAEWMVSEAGSSACFERGFVTYSNASKVESLGVDVALLEQHGAVSLEVAQAMAEGAQRKAGTDFALATTGIAGPDGGTEEKPVGTVAFALATPSGTYGQLLILPNRGRTLVRKLSSALALDMLRRYLTDKPVFGNYASTQVLVLAQP